jgi:hypothetical protein
MSQYGNGLYLIGKFPVSFAARKPSGSALAGHYGQNTATQAQQPLPGVMVDT